MQFCFQQELGERTKNKKTAKEICKEKVAYKNHREVSWIMQKLNMKRLRDIERKGFSNRNEKTCYVCPICKKWHLTSKTRYGSEAA